MPGLPGDNTFKNYQEANRAFWRHCVIPLVMRLQKSLQHWLAPGFGAFRFDYNAERIDALASLRRTRRVISNRQAIINAARAAKAHP